MPLPVDIRFLEMPRMPRVEAALRERLEALAGQYELLSDACIVVDTESNRFLTDHDYIVTITARCGDTAVVAGRHQRHPDLASAIECSFAALERQLHERLVSRTVADRPAAPQR